MQISLPGCLCRTFCATCATPFWGLYIDAGQQVLSALMKADRVTPCGPKGVPDAGRRAVCGGSTASQIVLGGRRIAVRRPRARSRGDGELALPSFEWAAGCNPLVAATLDPARLLTRRTTACEGKQSFGEANSDVRNQSLADVCLGRLSVRANVHAGTVERLQPAAAGGAVPRHIEAAWQPNAGGQPILHSSLWATFD